MFESYSILTKDGSKVYISQCPQVSQGPKVAWSSPGSYSRMRGPRVLGEVGAGGRECELPTDRCVHIGRENCERFQCWEVAQSLHKHPRWRMSLPEGCQTIVSPPASSFPPVSPSPGGGRDRQWGERKRRSPRLRTEKSALSPSFPTGGFVRGIEKLQH